MSLSSLWDLGWSRLKDFVANSACKAVLQRGTEGLSHIAVVGQMAQLHSISSYNASFFCVCVCDDPDTGSGKKNNFLVDSIGDG